MIRVFATAMCAALLAACGGDGSVADSGRLPPLDSAEHAVLTAVIRDAVREDGAEYAVFYDSTGIFIPDHVKPERLAQELQVPPALVRDFLDRNQHRYPLRPAFGAAGGETLVTRAEVEYVLEQPRAMDEPHSGSRERERRFPGSAGFATVSRVAFTADSSQAIAFFGIRCGELCGRASVVRVDRIEGEWKVATVALDYRS